MATLVVCFCDCGLPYEAYLPKAIFFEWTILIDTDGSLKDYTIEDFQAMDREEVAAGEVDLVKSQAKSLGFGFVDTREDGEYCCPRCQRAIPHSEILRKIGDAITRGA